MNQRTTITATRRLQFCAGHRVYKHESKCANMHGHNYVLHFSARVREQHNPQLDSLGRVIDFSVMKDKLGSWIESVWDHGFIYFKEDKNLRNLFQGGLLSLHKHYELPTNPTAENMAQYLLEEVCPVLFADTDIEVFKIVLHETENCSVEVSK